MVRLIVLYCLLNALDLFIIPTDNIKDIQTKVINQNEANNLIDVHFLDNELGYALSLDGIIIKTTNGGKKWKSSTLPESIIAGGIHFVSNSVGYVVGNTEEHCPRIYKTEDGGQTWLSQLPEEDGFTLNDVDFLENLGIAVGANVIYRTTDGVNWEKQEQDVNLHCVQIVSESSIFTAGAQGKILNSTDLGITWDENIVDSNHLSRGIAFSPNGLNGILVGSQGIYRTYDTGSTWFSVQPGLQSLRDVQYLSEYTIIAVGKGNNSGGEDDFYFGSYAFSSDGGGGWTEIPAVRETKQFSALHFPSLTTGYAVGLDYSILKFDIESASNVPNNFAEHIQVYPNPTTDFVLVYTTMYITDQLEYRIYDVNGREVANGLWENGASTDVSFLDSGLYYFTLINNGGTVWSSSKIVVQRP